MIKVIKVKLAIKVKKVKWEIKDRRVRKVKRVRLVLTQR